MTLQTGRVFDMRKMENDLAKDYESGMSEQQISIKYGFSIGTICRHMKKLGIYAREKPVRHGHNRIGKRTGTYLSWDTMIQRCSNPKNTNFPNYGGRGITVCERWRSFENFLADMGERPTGLTIERNNTNGNYEPGNCSWVTRKQQLNNQRRNVIVEWDGKRLTLSQWAELLGVDYMALWTEYRRKRSWPQ